MKERPRHTIGKAMMAVLKALEGCLPNVNNAELSERSGVGRASIHHAINNLETAGLIDRCGYRDRRRLRITEEGYGVLYPKPLTLRPCLSCRDEFASEGPGNRVCGRCKDTLEWKSPAAIAFAMQEAS